MLKQHILKDSRLVATKNGFNSMPSKQEIIDNTSHIAFTYVDVPEFQFWENKDDNMIVLALTAKDAMNFLLFAHGYNADEIDFIEDERGFIIRAWWD